KAIGSVAASAEDKRSGQGTVKTAEALTTLDSDPGASATTRCPGSRPATPGPTSTTRPTHSPPRGSGSPGRPAAGGTAPTTVSRSGKLSPAASTCIEISPGPGAGGRQARSDNCSSEPGRSTVSRHA